jgi:hypothetical protein
MGIIISAIGLEYINKLLNRGGIHIISLLREHNLILTIRQLALGDAQEVYLNRRGARYQPLR